MNVPVPADGDDALDDAQLATALRAEQLEQVYLQAARNQVFSPVVATLMGAGLWAHASHPLLAGWVLAMLVASVLRQALARAYLAGGPARLGSPAWERRFLVSTALVGTMWGAGSWMFMQGDDLRVDLFVYMFLVGMSGGTSAIYAAHVRTVVVTITCILLPATLHLLWRADALSVAAAIGGVLMWVAAMSSTRLLNAAMRRSVVLALRLDRQARVDALSGLANRRALTEAGTAMLAHAARTGRGCAALMVDVDHFKRVNDTRGHAAGDAVIAAMGALLSRSVRAGELAGRIGGEEFAILLPEADRDQAAALALRILERVRAAPVAHADGPIPITVSIGVAMARDGAVTLQALLDRADQALYRAKAGGRNRIEVMLEDPAT